LFVSDDLKRTRNDSIVSKESLDTAEQANANKKTTKKNKKQKKLIVLDVPLSERLVGCVQWFLLAVLCVFALFCNHNSIRNNVSFTI